MRYVPRKNATRLSAGTTKTEIRIDPFVFRAEEAALDLLEIGDVIDFTEVREPSCVRMRRALISLSTSSPSVPSTSSILVPYQIKSVSSNDMAEIPVCDCLSSERLGNTSMLTGRSRKIEHRFGAFPKFSP